MGGGPAGRLPDRRCAAHGQGPADGGVPMGWPVCGRLSSRRRRSMEPRRCGTGFIEIAVDRCLRSESVIVHRLMAPPPLVLHRDSIPVCDPTTTLFQLAAVLPPFRLEVALDCAMRLKLTHVGLLNAHLDRVARRGRNGISIIRRLLAERDPDEAPTASTLEDLLSRLIRRYGLPRPVPQLSVFDEPGRFVARPDFAYPQAKVAVEAQSYAFHHDRQQWEKDQRRLNRLVALGWRVIYVTARQMREHPEVVAAQIRSALRSTVAPPL